MSVSVFPIPSSGGGGGGSDLSVNYPKESINTWVTLALDTPLSAGNYSVEFIPEAGNVAVSYVSFLDSSGYGLGTANASTRMEFQGKPKGSIKSGAEAAYVKIFASEPGLFVFSLATNALITGTAPSKTVTTVATSGSVVLTQATNFALFGGGGGGGGTTGSAPSYYNRSRGGGSGYVTFGTLPAGTYTLSLGAGGSSDANGGTSTFSTFSAAGGFGAANGSHGGSGGGGGAVWYYFGGSANVGFYGTHGIGGANGSAGGTGLNEIVTYGSNGGRGSGVALPSWLANSIPSLSGNTGGGFYAGGSGGEGGLSGGGNATGYAGGGGGSASGNATFRAGGNGGNGVLMYWSAI